MPVDLPVAGRLKRLKEITDRISPRAQLGKLALNRKWYRVRQSVSIDVAEALGDIRRYLETSGEQMLEMRMRVLKEDIDSDPDLTDAERDEIQQKLDDLLKLQISSATDWVNDPEFIEKFGQDIVAQLNQSAPHLLA